MPTISMFRGIKITMYWADHMPPHFHAFYGGNEVLVSIEELEVLERIYVKFKDFGSIDISHYSHKEKGYSATKPGEIISYSYAKDIQLN